MNPVDEYKIAGGKEMVLGHTEAQIDFKKMELIKEAEQAQYLEDHLEILQAYFMENDGEGCIKDNVEDAFDGWLEDQDFDFLKSIIKKAE